MDVKMPVMDGIEATRTIGAAWPSVQAIALSLLDEAENAVIIADAGAVMSLGKSRAADLLVAAVRECMYPNASGS